MPDAEEGGGTNLSETNNQSMTLGSGLRSLHIGEEQMPYFLTIFVSIILLIDLLGADGANEAYGIAVAVVAMAVSIGAMALSYKMEETWTKVGIFIAYFLLLWNTIAAIILTFNGPFLATSNGYFACWALVFCGILAAKLKYGLLTQKLKTSGAIEGLLIASIILIIAIVFIGFESWRTIFALIVAILTVVLCAIFMYMDFSGGGGEKIRLPFMGIFMCLWLTVVILLTFRGGPFSITGNGYFAAWAGLIFCFFAGSTAVSSSS